MSPMFPILTSHSLCLPDLPATASPPTAPDIPLPSVQDLEKNFGKKLGQNWVYSRVNEQKETKATCSLSDEFFRPVSISCVTQRGEPRCRGRVGP